MGKRKRQIWKLYEVKEGKLIRKNKFCPVCGAGVFMAKHKDRWQCGKCGYTEWIQPKKKWELVEKVIAEINLARKSH